MRGTGRRPSVRCRLSKGVCLAALAGCTYGPVEDLARVEQIVGLGDSFEALVVVRHDRYRQPTGLGRFPDGGGWRYDERRASQYLINASARTVATLATQEAPDSLWESFATSIRGIEGDSVAYLALTGCPRGGECHPSLQSTSLIRLSTTGSVRRVRAMPPSASLPGTMLARRPGEANYVRFGRRGEFITARFDEDGPYEPVFRLNPIGVLEPIEGLGPSAGG